MLSLTSFIKNDADMAHVHDRSLHLGCDPHTLWTFVIFQADVREDDARLA